ncbi:hypothetical protein DTO169C6_5473 [Paecilomyces variotii]|nr:hypothetical protein DTO169C6_5473 [Paecilomyces variotii]KAJ9352495.1 hypothetical protein DTO027B9_5734 [Paecilomyces variotii]KAJ9394111.1 hypothetical protein DTO282F9_8968 [Paecilomyces variotii]
MASQVITLNVEPRGKRIRKLPKELQVPSNTSTQEIYASLAQATGYSIHRLRITKGVDKTVVPNSKDKTLEDVGLENNSLVHVKDLGPQAGWRTVYIIEYFGPLVIPALILYVLRPYIYFNFDKPIPEPSSLQALICALLTIHFLKRELETIFVHRFSSATMPARNIFKNCAHYWFLAGLNIAYWVFRPDAAAASDEPNTILLYSGLALFAFGEIANLNTHLVLRGLRKPGSTERGIPKGFGFGLVTCPNYMFEVIAWIGIYLLSGLSWSVLLFLIVGTTQMAIWARGKERRYRKEFGGKYKPKKFTMLPPIV